jgi:hypothetical protein
MARIMGGVSSIVTLINYTTFVAKVASVPVSGTPVQLPSVVVPDGAGLSIRALVSNGNKKIYVANSAVDTGIPANRIVLVGGETIELRIQNANSVWIDASHNNLGVELLVEQ